MARTIVAYSTPIILYSTPIILSSVSPPLLNTTRYIYIYSDGSHDRGLLYTNYIVVIHLTSSAQYNQIYIYTVMAHTIVAYSTPIIL